MAAAHPELLRVDAAARIVLRAEPPPAGKVGLISGGGSGHEPLHAGFVGPGMLDAACPGEIFTSPVPDQILAAARAVGAAGALLIVKNYSGDVMNFRLAAEMAEDEGLTVASVVIDDDVAVEDSLYTAGRRGTGATLLAEKIAGARAEEGGSLDELAGLVRQVNERARSFGVALTSCTTPAAGRPTFEIGPDEMEFGVGIHGEPGRRRQAMRSAAEIVAQMAEVVVGDLAPPPGSELLAFVNGLGATPAIELYVAYGELARLLEARGLRIARRLVGSYVTSLDMAGLSITLLRLDDELTRLWDAPVQTAALRWGR
jgi:dihydroxyacetone kinase-like protein